MSGTVYENLIKNVAQLDDVERRAMQEAIDEFEYRRPSDIKEWAPAAAYEAAYWEALAVVALRLKVYRQTAAMKSGEGEKERAKPQNG